MPSLESGRIKLLALDIDGTLVDNAGHLRPNTRRALARAAEAGIRLVLCTGRRYRRALPLVLELGLDSPVVCNSGAIVKDPGNHTTLWRADIDPAIVREVLAIFQEHNQPAISFLDRSLADSDFIVERNPVGRELFDDYLAQNEAYAEVRADWHLPARLRWISHWHLCAIDDRPTMLKLEAAVVARLGASVRTFVQRSPRYLGTMCEVLRGDADKWTAVQKVASRWGIEPASICAVGDDANDLPMIRGAGLGVAMGHASDAVKQAADWITSDNETDGLARIVDHILDN